MLFLCLLDVVAARHAMPAIRRFAGTLIRLIFMSPPLTLLICLRLAALHHTLSCRRHAVIDAADADTYAA